MARRYSRSVHGGVFYDDLRDAVNELRRSDREAAKAVTRGLRKSAILVQKKAHANQQAQSAPRTPTLRGAISRYAQQKEAGLILRLIRYPWAAPMEFGGNVAYLWYRPPGHPDGRHGWKGPQSQLGVRQFKPWVGNRWSQERQSGYVAQPAVMESLPQVLDIVADDVLDEIRKYLGGTKT